MKMKIGRLQIIIEFRRKVASNIILTISLINKLNIQLVHSFAAGTFKATAIGQATNSIVATEVFKILKAQHLLNF